MSASGEIDYSKDHLGLLIDDGSSTVKVTARLILPSRGLINNSIDVVFLQSGQASLEQQCVLLDDDDELGPRLLYGESSVIEWLQTHPTEGHRVIENSKLAFYTQYEHSPETRRFYHALGSAHCNYGALQRFTTLRIKHIIGLVHKYFKTVSPKTVRCRDLDWENLPTAVKFTVPAVVNGLMRSIYKNAGVDNGLRNVQLYLEPCCAAAFDIMYLLEQGTISYGDLVVWHDIGHLTNDLAAIRIDRPQNDHQPAQLTIAHPPCGDLHGSHLVHREAYEYVLDCDEVHRHGGIDSVLAKLGGISREELARQISAVIDYQKKQSPPRISFINLSARDDSYLAVLEGMPSLSIRISADRMQSWLDAWSTQLVRCQETYLRAPSLANVFMVVLTGGGSLNHTASDALGASGDRFGVAVRRSQSDMAVAKGGHEQYPRNEASAPRHGCCYLTRDEPLDKRRHRDAYLDAKRGERNPKLVTKSMDGNGWYATDRVVLALKYLPHEPKCIWRIPMSFPIALPAGSLEFKLYFSDQLRRNGAPLLDGQGNIRKLYSPYQIQFADPDIDWSIYESQLQTYQHKNNQWTNLDGFVQMECNDDEWMLKIEILKPGTRLREEDKKVAMVTATSSPFIPYNVLVERTMHIWDTHCTPDIPNASRAPSANISRKRRKESLTMPMSTVMTRRMTAEQALLSSLEMDSVDSISVAV